MESNSDFDSTSILERKSRSRHKNNYFGRIKKNILYTFCNMGGHIPAVVDIICLLMFGQIKSGDTYVFNYPPDNKPLCRVFGKL